MSSSTSRSLKERKTQELQTDFKLQPYIKSDEDKKKTLNL